VGRHKGEGRKLDTREISAGNSDSWGAKKKAAEKEEHYTKRMATEKRPEEDRKKKPNIMLRSEKLDLAARGTISNELKPTRVLRLSGNLQLAEVRKCRASGKRETGERGMSRCEAAQKQHTETSRCTGRSSLSGAV